MTSHHEILSKEILPKHVFIKDITFHQHEHMEPRVNITSYVNSSGVFNME
jgi:hypothetical protein